MFLCMATEISSSRPHRTAPVTAPDPSRTTAVDPRGLTAFLVLAFAFSWTAWWFGSRLLDGGDPTPAVLVGAFGPMVAAILVTAFTQGRPGVGALFRRHSLRRRGGIWPYAITALIVLAIAGAAALPVFMGTAAVEEEALRAALLGVPVQFVLIALVGGGNEELGWRGFALPRLQGALPPLAANVTLGAVWAVWHAPLFEMAGTVQSEVYFPAYALLCVGLTVVLGHVFNSARGGVIAVVIAHAAVNVVSGLKGMLVGDPAGTVEVTAVLTVAVLLTLFTRGRLGLRRTDDARGTTGS
ncbi:CPBP family intramembrane glutamic endopeptidase [Nocardiopsis prasina]|uniref:CPBP family intramembrane glutamic endopeptidase n=1 Tax=Nocardiopsis prasina TaxID=2015 RepID=UPI0004763E49|nr:type II CAAX endopeptidase family protein [Nocardiopsis prasina]